MTTFSPREIVSELDRYIVGQNDAKRAVAIALRNRWRRQQLEGAAARRGGAEEHLDDRPDGLRQDRDLAPSRQARGRALHQDRGDQIHGGRLCRPRRGADRARSRRDRHRPREGGAPPPGCRPRRISRRKSVCSMPSSARRPAPPPAIRSAASCAPTNSTTRRSRSSCNRAEGRGCRCSRSPACPAHRWARSTSPTCSARPSAADVRRRAAPP